MSRTRFQACALPMRQVRTWTGFTHACLARSSLLERCSRQRPIDTLPLRLVLSRGLFPFTAFFQAILAAVAIVRLLPVLRMGLECRRRTFTFMGLKFR